MNLRYYTMIGSLSAFAVGAVLVPPEARGSEQGVEELTRGPVHEAFAATVNFDPEPGMFVKTGPPTLIDEVPPDERPEGDNVNWIPGYWGWDEEGSDFIWISGVWRSLPPGRQWVPGYWGEEGSQWQWTSGYWQDEAAEEVAYLPKPPKSIEAGPNVEAPSRNHIWVSGSWVNREERYAWRPGYWQPGQENWTWIPAHYQWTRRGYVFIDGYWDYDVARRGVVFAPVRFQHETYERPNYSYTPVVVIALNVFASHLFVRPNYGHYYFGDYYEPRYRNEGYFASYSYRSGRNGYDPIYAQSRWEHRDDRDWERRRRDDFDYYRDNRDARPPRTWAAMVSRPVERRRGQRDNYEFAQPLTQYANRTDNSRRFQKVTIENRNEIVVRNKQVREITKDRQRMENRPNEKATEGKDKRIVEKREKIAKSPLAGKRPDQLTGADAPPKRHEAKDADAKNPKRDQKDGRADQLNRENGNRDQTPGPDNKNPKTEGRDQPGDKAKNQEKGDADRKGSDQKKPRSDQKENGSKVEKSDGTNRPNDGEQKPSKKETMQPEPTGKRQSKDTSEPRRAESNKSEEPKRQATPERKAPRAEPQLDRAKPAEKKQQKQTPERSAQPNKSEQPKRQAEPQRKAPRTEPQPDRPPTAEKRQQRQTPERATQQNKPEQPKRQAEPERKAPRAEPQPDRQRKEPSGEKKKPSKDEDPDSKKKG